MVKVVEGRRKMVALIWTDNQREHGGVFLHLCDGGDVLRGGGGLEKST